MKMKIKKVGHSQTFSFKDEIFGWDHSLNEIFFIRLGRALPGLSIIPNVLTT